MCMYNMGIRWNNSDDNHDNTNDSATHSQENKKNVNDNVDNDGNYDGIQRWCNGDVMSGCKGISTQCMIWKGAYTHIYVYTYIYSNLSIVGYTYETNYPF